MNEYTKLRASLTNNCSLGEVILRMPYNEETKEAMKECVPYDYRSWDPKARVWRIHNEFGGETYKVLVDLGVKVKEIITVNKGDKINIRNAYGALYLSGGVPFPVCHVKYKALALRLHPDIGGDTRSMQLLNDALSVIKKQATHIR